MQFNTGILEFNTEIRASKLNEKGDKTETQTTDDDAEGEEDEGSAGV